jgi:hypothetical protein
MDLIFESIILPLVNKLIIVLKGVFNGILKMVGPDKGHLDIGESSGGSPTPKPNEPTNIPISDSKKDEDMESKKNRDKEVKRLRKAFDKYKKAESNPGNY